MTQQPTPQVSMKLENAAKGDLLRHLFDHLPSLDDSTLEREQIATCERVIAELRRRAEERLDLVALRDVHTCETEMYTRIEALKERIGIKQSLSGLLHVPGAR